MLKRYLMLVTLDWCFWLLMLATRLRADTEQPPPSLILSARCHIRCLTLLKNQHSTKSDVEDNDDDDDDDLMYSNAEDDFYDDADYDDAKSSVVTLQTCQQDSFCTLCSKPCQEIAHWDNCIQLCSQQEACEESCRFLTEVNRIRGGVCPRETQAVGAAAICTRACSSDADCHHANHKCCSNSCGWTCQLAAHYDHGTPQSVGQPLVHSISAHEVRVAWTRPPNHHDAILYILERKAVDAVTMETVEPWIEVARTGQSWALVDGQKFGSSYFFRVSAVNIYGSRGPSPNTNMYTFSKEPERPGAPTNLREGDSSIENGLVSVTIHWVAPIQSDLPIQRYKIQWSEKERVGSAPLKEYRQVVPSSQLHFTLSRLKPDTTYFVQIQAVSQYGEVKLKSNRSAMYVTTYPLPRWQDRGVEAVDQVENSFLDDFLISKPFYQNGLLKANVTWNKVKGEMEHVTLLWLAEGCAGVDSRLPDQLPPPMTAISHVNAFTIYDLRFGCKYLVRAQEPGGSDTKRTGVFEEEDNEGRKLLTIARFLDTPFCEDVIVYGLVKPDCPKNACQVEEVLNVQHKFIVGTATITLKMAWVAPSVPAPQPTTLVNGYLLTWTTTQQHIANRSNMASKMLSKDMHVYSIASMQERAYYVARIQGCCKQGFGRIYSLHLRTPSFSTIQQDIEEISSNLVSPDVATKTRPGRPQLNSALITISPRPYHLATRLTPPSSHTPPRHANTNPMTPLYFNAVEYHVIAHKPESALASKGVSSFTHFYFLFLFFVSSCV